MKRYFTLAVTALIAFATTFTSCNDVTLDNTPFSEPVTNLTSSVNKKDVTISWVAPAGADEVAVFKDNTQVAALPISTTSYTFKNAADGEQHIYTVKAIYKEAGRISEGVSITRTLESNTKAAFLLPTSVADYTALPDDDEQAAGEYFKTNFVDAKKGLFIHASDIASLNLDSVPVIWIMIDRVDISKDHIGDGKDHLYSKGITDANIFTADELNIVKEYVKKGGNLYLSNHASMIATIIGRTPYEVTCFGNGAGGTHDDIWSTHTVLGSAKSPIDCSDHDIFSGITQGSYGYAYNTIALLGPGSQEDHNCFWIPADIQGRTWGDNGDVNTIPDYQKALTCKVLAGWGQVTDYCVGAITEFLPTDEYQGTVLCNGLAAMEFHQDKPATGDQNAYQKNIEKMTTNTLNYLK